MRTRLIFIFAFIYIALFSFSALAIAPNLQPLPDIVIGDREDWAGTIDTNIFVFPDAFSLDDYVDDPDTPDSVLIWAFMEADITTPLNLEINTITSLDSAPLGPGDIPIAKDLRAISDQATFFDLLAPSTLMNETIVFYVTDGTDMVSDEVRIMSIDNDFDRLIAPSTQAPEVQCLPDIIISDREDWVGTLDTNIFIFPDAFSLDDYVADPDTPDNQIMWAFKEADLTPPLNLAINNITSLPGEAHSPADIPSYKDIRATTDLAFFHDLLAPADFMDETVIFYVTDGVFVDSDEMRVTTIDDDFDRLIPSCVQGPRVECLPDILIGDREDWVGTIDTDIFVFPDAFSFDDYVYDPDTPDDQIMWAFKEADLTPPLNLEINGITSLAAPASAPTDIPFAKDLRAVANYASFFDRLAPATFVDEAVIFYVSDGTYVDSDEIWVMSADDIFDQVVAACCPQDVATWTFEGTLDGWNYHTGAPPAGIPDWENAVPLVVTGPGAIALTAAVGETTDYYGSWDNYSGDPTVPAIDWIDNSVWRAIFAVSSNKADANTVPSIRLRIAENQMKAASYIRVYPGGWVPLAQRGTGTTDYTMYMRPPIVDHGFFLAFDLIDFRPSPYGVDTNGTVYLEEVIVDRFDTTNPCLDSYWTDVKSYSGMGLHSWAHSSAGVPYLSDVSFYAMTSDGLRMDTAPAQTRAFGAWNSPVNEVVLTPNQLYRGIWTLSCQDSTLVGTIRVRMHTADFRYASYMSLNRDPNPANSALPPLSGDNYYIYADFPAVPTADRLVLAWDLYDFDPGAGGWASLNSVIVSRRDLP